MAYQQGGWYDNPATGKNQRWWNGGFLPVGQTDPSPSGGSSSGGGGGGGAQSADDILNNAIQSILKFIPKPPKPYEQVNPFSFDENLARQAATAEYTPYYSELLTDYTSNVERNKARSQQDLTDTLSQLAAGKEYYLGTQRRLLDQAERSTNEGYAGRGLFLSGARQRDIQNLQTENTAQVGNYMSNYDYNVGQAQKSNTRTLENLTTGQSQYNRDIQREQQAAIESGVLQRKSEAQTEYEMARQKYYDNAMYGGLA